jgi:hypothetical protein
MLVTADSDLESNNVVLMAEEYDYIICGTRNTTAFTRQS